MKGRVDVDRGCEGVYAADSVKGCEDVENLCGCVGEDSVKGCVAETERKRRWQRESGNTGGNGEATHSKGPRPPREELAAEKSRTGCEDDCMQRESIPRSVQDHITPLTRLLPARPHDLSALASHVAYTSVVPDRC